MFKDIYEELSYKFKHLPELKPQHLKTKINSNNMIDDDFVHEISPERYTFYLEFQKALKDPAVLKDLIYEYKMIKNDKEEENKIIDKIVSKINQLYVVPNPSKMDNKQYVELKNRLKKEESDQIANKVKNIVVSDMSDDINVDDAVNKVIYSTFSDEAPSAPPQALFDYNPAIMSDMSNSSSDLNDANVEANNENLKNDNKSGGGKEFANYKKIKAYRNKNMNDNDEFDKQFDKSVYQTNISKLQDQFDDKSLLNQYRKNLQRVDDDKTVSNKIKAQKFKDIVSEIEDNEVLSIDNLKLSKEDKLVFIGITFVIRLIVLWLLDWSLVTNFVSNFTKSFMLYILIYTLLLLIIVAVVNITYNMSIVDLYGGSHGIFTSLASTLYYFYFIPGSELRHSYRILFHLGLMYFIVAIALLVKEKEHDHKDGLSYDYVEKKRILRVVSDFTLIIWAFTSILAMYNV